MSTAPVNLNDFPEDNLSKSLVERESAVKERLQAAWQLHIARVQEELESGWQSHIAVAVEGILVNLQDSLRQEMQESAKQLAESRLDEVRQVAEREMETALEEARQAADSAQAESLAELRESMDERYRQDLNLLEAGHRFQMQSLHKSVRRCEQAESREDVVAAVLDGVSPYAERALLLQVEGNMITSCHTSAPKEEGAELAILDIPVEQAPALNNAKQAAEPLVAMRIESEFSSAVLGQLGAALDEKLRVFPIVTRNNVKALLVLEAGSRTFDAGAIEILTIAAGHKWTVGKESTEPAQLIAIQGTGNSESKSKDSGPSWFQLSPQEQEVHLRAQRFARVQVAELRLYQSERVRQARKDGDIYGVFRKEIDQARQEFRTQFIETCPSMLDYYHMELVRILANEKEMVLGPEYPGPLV